MLIAECGIVPIPFILCGCVLGEHVADTLATALLESSSPVVELIMQGKNVNTQAQSGTERRVCLRATSQGCLNIPSAA